MESGSSLYDSQISNNLLEATELETSSEDEFDDDGNNDENDILRNLTDMELRSLDEKQVSSMEEAFPDMNKDCSSMEEVSSKALVSVGPQDDDDDIDSEEERDIMKEIREEIEKKVRGEMKDELEEYQQQLLAIESGQLPSSMPEEQNSSREDTEPSEITDPKLKEAIIKMRKLDKILNKRVKREKQVKRDRLVFERRMRQEISQMKHGASHYREIKTNTEKFLALAPPPSHNEGMTVEEEEEEEDLPPLFQTQIDDSEIRRGRGKLSEDGDMDENGTKERAESTTSSQGESSRATTSRSNDKKRGKKNKKKDFIKRNKELAADADQPVAMTDDEKRRLQMLLEDIDEIPELPFPGSGEDEFDNSSLYCVPRHLGEGFLPDSGEMNTLLNIDSQLKCIMPEEDYASVRSRCAKEAPTQPLFTHVGIKSTLDIPERFGERVLYDTKEERDMKARLLSIEQELDAFSAPLEDQANPDEVHLTDEQLDKLLDQCARSMSRASHMETPDSTPRSQLSSRQSLFENPPRLTDEQLQQLLSEAHFPLSSRLLALREDDEKLLEENGSTEVIRAETWKAIMSENLEEEEEGNSQNQQEKNTLQNYCQGNEEINASSHENSPKRTIKNAGSVGPVPEELDRDLNPSDVAVRSPASQGATGDGPRLSSRSFEALPKISHSNGGSRPASQIDCSKSTGRESVDSSAEPVRLPSIKSNSFLIHTAQGLNNKHVDSSLPSRKPLQMVRNDLTEMRMASFSEDECSDFQGQSRRSSQSNPMVHIPRPPSKENNSDRKSSHAS